MSASDTIQVFVPLKIRRKNGRPKIMPPADYLPSEDQVQDPHILRAIGRYGYAAYRERRAAVGGSGRRSVWRGHVTQSVYSVEKL
jgi:hypothetical protein